MFPRDLVAHAARLVDICRVRGLTVSVAESCTGGLVTAVITAVPGASNVLEIGLVTYRDSAKIALLGVPKPLLDRCGAVSPEVAEAMAAGARARGGTDLGVATTGYAGPDTPSDGQPIGRVFIATVRRDRPPVVRQFDFADPGRERVQLQAVAEAIALLIDAAGP